jgi:hypothetical protein
MSWCDSRYNSSKVLQYYLKYSNESTFKRPNESGTTNLASEIKIKTNEKLFQNFQISQLESVKKNSKFKDGDGMKNS